MMLVGCQNEPNLKAAFYDVQVTDADWVPMEDMYHYAKVEMPQITENVFRNGLVQVYRVIESNDRVYYAPLPATLTDFNDEGELYSLLIDYDYTVGEVYIYYTIMDLSTFDNPGEHKFRVAVYQ